MQVNTEQIGNSSWRLAVHLLLDERKLCTTDRFKHGSAAAVCRLVDMCMIYWYWIADIQAMCW